MLRINKSLLVLISLFVSGRTAWSQQQDLGESIKLGIQLTEGAYRNFEVSIRHNSRVLTTPPVNANERNAQYAIENNNLYRIWLDYERQQVVMLFEESAYRTPSELSHADSDTQSSKENSDVIRKEVTVCQYKDGVGSALKKGAISSVPLRFNEFMFSMQVPRVELAAFRRFPICTLLTTEEYTEKMAAAAFPGVETSFKRLPDGLLMRTSAAPAAGIIVNTYFHPRHNLPVKSTILAESNGRVTTKSSRTVEFDDYEIVDRPLKIVKSEMRLITDPKNDSEWLQTDTDETIEFKWSQFNEDELRFPDFDKIASAKSEFDLLIGESWSKQEPQK